MVIASLRKFEQNSDLRAQLFATNGSILVEASPSDNYWGVGLAMDNPNITFTKSWPGLNVLGRILTRLRILLMNRSKYKSEIVSALVSPKGSVLSNVN